jgi:Arc/MetJ-type ribon-helix-helix transcriptional regulator
MGKDKVTLKIPRPLYNKLKQIIEETGFSSVNEFVVYILRDLAALQKGDDKELSADEVRLIKERLKNLGYL